jgi:hypothetical protein
VAEFRNVLAKNTPISKNCLYLPVKSGDCLGPTSPASPWPFTASATFGIGGGSGFGCHGARMRTIQMKSAQY